jgi:tRNA U34 2-thiouridine synthase MnmA/TrmU
MKALALLSGGLDSILAIKVAQEAGVEVEAINFIIPFVQSPDQNGVGKAANASKQLNVKLHYHICDEDYLQMIENPNHGYGKRMNPCLDCRIYTFKTAAQKMREIGASFLITGEVFDQRPNSQRLDALDITARDAGLKDLIVRPLSAKLLRETLPERQGWINREKLLDIKGRGRTRQIALAAHYGITDYPSPAGGCLLTNEEYSLKVKDLIKHQVKLSIHSVNLLRLGRHLRLSPNARIVIGKDQTENELIQKAALPADILLELTDFAGPIALYMGTIEASDLDLAAAMTAGYGNVPDDEKVRVNVRGAINKEILVKPMPREEMRKYFVYKV